MGFQKWDMYVENYGLILYISNWISAQMRNGHATPLVTKSKQNNEGIYANPSGAQVDFIT